VRIEIVVPDEDAEAIFKCITEVAQTGHYGDGLLWMTDIVKAAFVFKTTPGSF
jgi:nitrogen regulatory protein P-II 1